MSGMPVMGTETEYGILAPAAPELDPGLLSAAVVACWDGPATSAELDPAGPIPIEDAHNRFLGNGARLYVDHAHPEYSAPETTNAVDAVTYDLAGDEIVRRAAVRASALLGTEVRLFKNNTDGKGASYGFHENYQLPRTLPWDDLVAALLPHLVTRLPLTGAGRVGLGQRGGTPGFQLSQRADFFERITGLDTTLRRPIVNTRDEPHARASQWRRLHVIAGDANLAHTSRLLTIGTTAAVLAGAVASVLPAIELADPLAAIRAVSRDPSCTALLDLADGRRVRALDVQQDYLDALHAWGEADPAVLGLWQATLDDLRREPAACADRLDWAAKLRLLEQYREREGLDWAAPRLAQIDLAYADLDPGRSVHAALVSAGRLRTVIPDEAVARAVAEAPADTRAFLRGLLVREHRGSLLAVDWAAVLVRSDRGRPVTLRLDDPTGATRDALPDLAGRGLDAVLAAVGR